MVPESRGLGPYCVASEIPLGRNDRVGCCAVGTLDSVVSDKTAIFGEESGRMRVPQTQQRAVHTGPVGQA